VRYHQCRGKSFHTIIRILAYKWINILTRAWRDRELYDEEPTSDASSATAAPSANISVNNLVLQSVFPLTDNLRGKLTYRPR
jgi:hypothetical protein